MNSIAKIIDNNFIAVLADNGVRFLYDGIPVSDSIKSDDEITEEYLRNNLRAAYMLNDKVIVIAFTNGCYLFRKTQRTISSYNAGGLIKYKEVLVSGDAKKICAYRNHTANPDTIYNDSFKTVRYGPENIASEIKVKSDEKKSQKARAFAYKLSKLDKGLPSESTATIHNHLAGYISLIKQGACPKDNLQFRKVLATAMAKIPAYRTPIEEIKSPASARARLKLEQDLAEIGEKPAENPDLAAIKENISRYSENIERVREILHNELLLIESGDKSPGNSDLADIVRRLNGLHPRRYTADHKQAMRYLGQKAADCNTYRLQERPFSVDPGALRAHLSTLVSQIRLGIGNKDDPFFRKVLDAAVKNVSIYHIPFGQIKRRDSATVRLRFEQDMIEIGEKPAENPDYIAAKTMHEFLSSGKTKIMTEIGEKPAENPDLVAIKFRIKELGEVPCADIAADSVQPQNLPKYLTDLVSAKRYLCVMKGRLRLTPGNERLKEQVGQMQRTVDKLREQKCPTDPDKIQNLPKFLTDDRLAYQYLCGLKKRSAARPENAKLAADLNRMQGIVDCLREQKLASARQAQNAIVH